MERIRVPAGTAQKFESVFKKLQDAIQKNQFNRIDIFVKSYGSVVNVNNNTAQDNNWKIQVLDANNRQIQVLTAGADVTKGLAKGDHYTKLPSPATMTIAPGTGTEEGSVAYSVIYAEHRDEYADNLPVVDGFVYDSSGHAAQAATAINDVTVLIQNSYNTLSSAWSAAANPFTSRITLGIIKVHKAAGEWVIDLTWDDLSNPVRTITDGVCDLRPQHRLLLNENLLDDSKLLFKDRDSLRLYNRGVQGKVTFEKRVHFDQSVSLTKGSRLSIGGTNGLIDETTSQEAMLENESSATIGHPAISVHGNNRQDASIFLKTTATTAGQGPQLRFISETNSYGIVHDPTVGWLKIGPMDPDNINLQKATQGVVFGEDGALNAQNAVNLGTLSITTGDDYNVTAYANMLLQKTLQVGRQMIVGRHSNWNTVDFDTTNPGYETLTVMNDDATTSNKASIFINQEAKGPGHRASLKFQVTDTSSNTFRNYIRMDTTAVNNPVLDIGQVDVDALTDTRFMRFDKDGNLGVEKNATVVGSFTVAGTSNLYDTLTTHANLVATDQVGIGVAQGTNLQNVKPVLSISNTHNAGQTTLVDIANSSNDSDAIIALGGPSSGGGTYRFGLHAQIAPTSSASEFTLGRIHPTNNNLQNSFITWDYNGNATADNNLTIADGDGLAVLTAEIFRNTHGATFNEQAIFVKKVGIGYADGTDTSTWGEQLKLTNPNGINHVTLKLENSENELDSKIVFETKNSGGNKKKWGVIAEGSNDDFYIGTLDNGDSLMSYWLRGWRDEELLTLGKHTEMFANKNFTVNGGNLSATTTQGYSVFKAAPSSNGIKVAAGYRADELAAFTNTGGNQGDYDLVVGNKDASGTGNANLALVTEKSSDVKEFEIEVNHTANRVNMNTWTSGMNVHFKNNLNDTKIKFGMSDGAITASSLTLEGNINEGSLTAPLIMPQAEPLLFDGSAQDAHMHSVTASGGHFSIYNNVVPYSFGNELTGDAGQTQDTSNGWAGITLATHDTSQGGQIEFYTGKNPGNNNIASKTTDKILNLGANAGGTKYAQLYSTLYLLSSDGSAGNVITNGNNSSWIYKLAGQTLDYTNANLTHSLEAGTVKTPNLEAGGVFASSGLSIVTIKGRLDVDADQLTNSVIALHRQHGTGAIIENTGNNLRFSRAEFEGTNYHADRTLIDANFAANRVTIGGQFFASSGVFAGDLFATGQSSADHFAGNSSNVYSATSTMGTITNLTTDTLNLRDATVQVNPGTSFDCAISGVTRPGYLVVASGSNYYIGQGELGLAANDFPGVELMVAPARPTTATNFRITDINPHSDTNLSQNRISLEWGYNNIIGSEGPDHVVQGTVYKTFGPINGSNGSDNIDLPDSNGQLQVSGRYLRMPSGKKHKVIAWDNSTKYLTLDFTYDDSESTDAANPARLVDHGKSYTLNILKRVDGVVVPWDSLTLGESFVNDPKYVLDLEIGPEYYFSLATNYDTKSTSAIMMASGVFDPDSNAGGQGLMEYGVPFANKLPYLQNLPTLSDHLTLDADNFGFQVSINGWGSTDFGQTLNSDPNQIAHQFEIGYTTADTFDWASHNTVRQLVPFVSASNVPISNISNSDTYTVAVRPIQNNQVVYDEATHGIIKKSILAGGGGAPPNMQCVVDQPWTLVTYSGTYQGQFNQGNYDLVTISGVSFHPDPLTGAVTVGYNQMSANSGGIMSTFSSDALSDHTIISNGQFDGLNTGNEGGTGVSTITMQIAGTATTEFTSTATDFTIGTTETARKLFETQFNADYRLRKIVVDVDFATGATASNPGIIRIYPKGNPGAGDSIQITAGQGLFTQVIDLTINTNLEPNRTIVVDAFDTSASPNNNWSGTGRIWVYGQPYDSNMNQNFNA